MQKFKKITALALATVMIIGGSMTAFADEPAVEGSLTGTGSSEGTVDKHIIKVVLPTVATDSEMFNFTVDSERLLQETEHARLGDAVIFPEQETDTGVYFITDDGADKYAVVGGLSYDEYTVAEVETGDELTDTTYYVLADSVYTETEDEEAQDGVTYYTLTEGTDVSTYYVLTDGDYAQASGTAQEGTTYYSKTVGSNKTTYANASAPLTVESQSSAAVELTVEVQASAAETDFALVSSADDAKGETDTAKLYLALTVGSEDPVAVVAGDKVTKTVTIAGDPENFETVYDNGYVFAPVASPTWATETFSLSGAVSQASAKGLTAPTLTVTWSYADPAAVPAAAAPSIATTSYTAEAGKALAVAVDLGIGDLAATAIESITFERDGSPVVVNTSRYAFANNTITFASDWVDQQIAQFETSREYTITFNDDKNTKVKITVKK